MRLRQSFRVIALMLAVAAGQACVKVHVGRETSSPAAVTTIVLVRHAEKSSDDPKDPSISSVGQARAGALAETLREARVSTIYVTQFKRTRQTADSTSKMRGLSVIERPAATPAVDLAREVLANHTGETVLIVGHSNTIPQIVQAFSGVAVPPIADSEYDHLFIVVLSQGKAPQLYSSHYGRSTQ